ncbi:MAG: hypothetical protein R3A79_31525 [Nannocystaceae bacterium]
MSFLRTLATVALVSSSFAIGCRPPDVQPDPNAAHPLRASAEVYTLVNLHPDDDRELSSVNYLDDEELLPLCTPIRVTFLNTEILRFTVLSSGKEYTFEFHDTMKESPGENVAKFFGTECDAAVVASLPEIDQQGIREGKALEGMSKQGVLLAIGYPPEHRTPSLDGDTWRYWESKLDTLDVIFENGVVVKIDD